MALQPGGAARLVLQTVDQPRPLKSTLKQPIYEVQSIEDLIIFMENIASQLSTGACTNESVNLLSSHLRALGVQVELLAKDSLDKAFVSFRNASQDERLSVLIRLNLLELIELRAKGWQITDNTTSYYKHKASNVEPDYIQVDLSTSPQGILASTNSPASIITSLGPGEMIRNSGKFSKPTKIPGKNYSKDEVVIRNADSGKVNPGAKERLVQITGPNEEKINYAKHLIEDTIRRNASPIRIESQHEEDGSSLASSTSDEPQPRKLLSHGHQMQSKYRNPQQLLHSFSTSDATLGEYKFTVTVGGSMIKITGDNLELVRSAKLVLEDHFSSTEFVMEAATPGYENQMSFDGYSLNPNAPSMIPLLHQGSTSVPSTVDSGIAIDKLNLCRGITKYQKQKGEPDGDDDVFIVEENGTLVSVNAVGAKSTTNNGSNRSRKTNFQRKSQSPEEFNRTALQREISHEYKVKMFYQPSELLEMAKGQSAISLPRDWIKICEKWPSLVRNKVKCETTNPEDAKDVNITNTIITASPADMLEAINDPTMNNIVDNVCTNSV